ncbi:Zinc finger, U1-type [Corchorus capsularis]|uniref:Zinc finger, U1-type n=1 Tax=Corchorus capsularis TaxID=210143 RepID=A0A1R3HEE2_COCAP|nr:Zinc finger, U1-type [Corchorus capsularis]
MDEARKEDDIMPLELAIQREMGYRQKIAMLSMKSANDSGLQLKPLQPGLTSHLRLDSHVSEDQKDMFFCEVCQVSCSSAKTYKQHVKGQKHRTNLHFPFKGNDEAATTAVNSRKKCELCGVWCMNESSFNQHLEGQKHKERLQNLELTGNNARSMVKKQRFW